MAFPFLSLPLEIRRPIYRYALPYSVDDSWPRNVHQSQYSMHEYRALMRTTECPVRWYKGICPNIVYANRQIHDEACEILYHENTFTVFVKHPRRPRLPLNESRADDDSFIQISWKHRSWAHPRNPKIPLAVLRNHRHRSQVCRLHVNLPDMRDLFAADLYMRTTSFASHHGLKAWIERLHTINGMLDPAESERMRYIQQIKGPIDEVAEVLRGLPRINQLVILFQSESHEVAFVEYVASEVLNLRDIEHAQCLYNLQSSCFRGASNVARIRDVMMTPRMQSLEIELQSPKGNDKHAKPDFDVTDLSAQAVEMLEMLESMRSRILLLRQLRSEYTDDNVDTLLPNLAKIME